MGINANGLRFLLHVKSQGVNLSRVAMIGRQGIHMAAPTFRSILNEEFQCGLDDRQLDFLLRSGYAEELFRFLGAVDVHSFDYADYEGATYVHDFNAPIPECHQNRYTTVIDGGTLEHIFNFPTALKNCMEMLEVGGTYLGVSPANNELGHGFYQLSPELYFRAFSNDNGFRVDEMYLHEGRENKKWFKISDPDVIRQRVTLVNTVPTLLLVRATRVEDKEIFARAPLQSDYVQIWTTQTPLTSKLKGSTSSFRSDFWRIAKQTVPRAAKRILWTSWCWLNEKITRARILCGFGHDSKSFTPFYPKRGPNP